MQCKLKALGEIISNNEFLNSILETEAWKGISGKQSLRMGILDGYAYKLDLNEISRNPIITWTLDGMTKFADKLNWNDFSENRSDYIINEVTLRKFADRRNWKAISSRGDSGNTYPWQNFPINCAFII